jgi:chaperonin GroES
MEFYPLDDRIVVELEEAEDKTEGGIVLPDAAKEKPQRGKVLAVGNGKLLPNGQRVAPLVKNGDRILFGKYAGTEVKHEGKEYKILKESEILAQML